MKAGSILAVDIGRTGALALLSPAGDLLAIEDMPCVADGPAYRLAPNGALLATIVRRWSPTEAVVEHVAARPKDSPVGAFSFGRSRGVIEGVLASAAVPVRFVSPAWWKRRVGIPPGIGMKDTARAKALARWPARADWFARALDHDRAEAALLGLAHRTDDPHTTAA